MTRDNFISLTEAMAGVEGYDSATLRLSIATDIFSDFAARASEAESILLDLRNSSIPRDLSKVRSRISESKRLLELARQKTFPAGSARFHSISERYLREMESVELRSSARLGSSIESGAFLSKKVKKGLERRKAIAANSLIELTDDLYLCSRKAESLFGSADRFFGVLPISLATVDFLTAKNNTELDAAVLALRNSGSDIASGVIAERAISSGIWLGKKGAARLTAALAITLAPISLGVFGVVAVNIGIGVAGFYLADEISSFFKGSEVQTR